jgi:hypothetical protein
MTIERSYGNSSAWENAKRLKLGNISQPTNDKQYPIETNSCLTCHKTTNHIPNTPKGRMSPMCQMVCGDTTRVITNNRLAYLKSKAKRTTLTLREQNEISQIS